MPLVKFFVNVAVSTKKCSLQNHGGVTKSHCCDSQTVANGFSVNSAVTLGGTLPTFPYSRSQCTCICLIQQ